MVNFVLRAVAACGLRRSDAKYLVNHYHLYVPAYSQAFQGIAVTQAILRAHLQKLGI